MILPLHWFSYGLDKVNDGFLEANMVVESVSHISKSRWAVGQEEEKSKVGYTGNTCRSL